MTKTIGIIGGGIVGSTAAYYLTKHNKNVTVFDEGIGQATSASAGIISPWLSQRRNKEWYFLAKEGAKFYSQLIDDLSQTNETKEVYQKTGTLLYKKNEALLAKLNKLAEDRKLEAPEIGDIKVLSKSDITKLFPEITLDDSALFITGGAKIDGAKLVEMLLNEAQKASGTIIKTKITEISYQNEQWYLKEAENTHIFDQLILAGGAWVGDLLRPLDLEVDIRPQKGQLIEIEAPFTTNELPVVMPVGETDIIPFDQGKILIGATHENDQGFDLTPDNSLLQDLKQNATDLLSSIEEASITNTRVGTRAYTSDFSPFFGEVADLPNFLVASGLGSSGLTTGAIIGKTLADWTLEQDTNFESYRHLPNQYIYPKKVTIS
ncbi:NAD(P)/FAD-dependent oxidoreductase [Vagococcus carniphilus]|uniref:NAD(P)/FAD-dependent oxidoreductase n=1 Tax=Vagococcus carniphilus TaxID=218144 RepID=UPI0028920A68|nr:FAD-dependent oxidoreductase [Vagococcus carniphilus]MDT2815793.1 FAD-dependent oxidoreductase [Vagococcus carniphilus]MDT2866212.1 FAD-dependent oxidoreductase [Vagococcus carniphilus]